MGAGGFIKTPGYEFNSLDRYVGGDSEDSDDEVYNIFQDLMDDSFGVEEDDLDSAAVFWFSAGGEVSDTDPDFTHENMESSSEDYTEDEWEDIDDEDVDFSIDWEDANAQFSSDEDESDDDDE